MQYSTLSKTLESKKHLHGVGITFIDGVKSEDFLSYADLYLSALKALRVLQHAGVKPSDELVFQVENNKTFIIAFWACILGGIIPVPLAKGTSDDRKEKLLSVLPVLFNPFLLASRVDVSGLLIYAKENGIDPGLLNANDRIIDENSIYEHEEKGTVVDVKPDDIAFVQFSSGSTGSPKGVILTHKNLILNIEAITAVAGYTNKDSMLSWMPLSHDMGLIGFHLNPLFCGISQYLISTNLFVRNPSVWLDKASQHKTTVLSSPNFGYKYLLKHFSERSTDWDLSSVRIIYNGAEPISKSLCDTFLSHLSCYGLKENAMCPVYGLAEATLAVSMSKPDDIVATIFVDRSDLKLGNKVTVSNESENAISVVNVGMPINCCALRITDNQGVVFGDDIVGCIEIKGEAVCSGYYNNIQETRKAITRDGWLKTGDLGFVHDDGLYVTGRSKDVIFVNGQNFYAHDVERIAESVPGIELNKIVVVGETDNQTQGEVVIAFVFHRGPLEKFLPTGMALKKLVNKKLGFELDKTIPVKDIPKTTSGKLQRFKLLEQYRKGSFDDTIFQLNWLEVLDGRAATGAAPQDTFESDLVDIWMNILKRQDIGVDQSFLDLGGNSLKAAEIAFAIQAHFGVEIPINLLYEKGTIRAIAAELPRLPRSECVRIPQLPPAEYYPLTSTQKRLYYLSALDKESTVYNIPVVFRVDGELHAEKINTCIQKLVDRHDSLRMYFRDDSAFCISSSVPFFLTHYVCSRQELMNKLKSLILPFDLSRAPLFRISLLSTAENEAFLFLDFHHLISDGYSIVKFVQELFFLYNQVELAPVAIQFKDYVIWELERTAKAIGNDRSYWKGRLSGEIPILEIPTDFKRPAVFDHIGETIEFRLNSALTADLRTLATIYNCTVHDLLFSVYNILLHKYTANRDIVVGIPVNGRNHSDLFDVQGLFVKTLAMRTLIQPDESFESFLLRNVIEIREALNHQEFPFSTLVEMNDAPRDASRNPVFDTMFVYQNMEFPGAQDTSLAISKCFFDPGVSKFDLSMEVFDHGGPIVYNLEYAKSLFKREKIQRLGSHFEALIKAVVTSPRQKIVDVNLMDVQEYNYFVLDFNNTGRDNSHVTSVIQLFEEQALKTPHAIAIEHGESIIEYSALLGRVLRLACVLQQQNIGKDDVVGILLPRSPEAVISILSVLKAGGCYLPIDNDFPDERIRLLLSDSRCRLLVTDSANSLKYSSLIRTINFYDAEPALSSNDVPTECEIGENLAYIIYTSGTSGTPKGVMISHNSLLNYTSWAAENYLTGPETAFPLYTSLSFDLTITSIFTPLVTGNRIIVYTDNDRELLLDTILKENKVDIIKLTPSHLKLILANRDIDYLKSRIKKIIVGGERLDSSLARGIYEKFDGRVDIINEYGPTEATVGCMFHLFNPEQDDGETVPIGRPIDNMRIYLLDNYDKPILPGVKGEIYIAGRGVSRGYLFNAEYTKSKFLPSPFKSGEWMYKTGDVAVWDMQGKMVYVGRTDEQVKIRGYRVELSEVELSLSEHPQIQKVAVVKKGDSTDSGYLCAYYVRKPGEKVNADELRNFLFMRLPHYMAPYVYLEMDELPLTINGKIDPRRLPAPLFRQTTTALGYLSPLEEMLLEVWQDVLNDKRIGVEDRFFQIGGDSIKAVQISSRLFEKQIHLKPKDILRHQSIRLAATLCQTDPAHRHYLQHVPGGERQLSPIEQWFFDNAYHTLPYYNQSVLLDLKEHIETAVLNEALSSVVNHHDVFRTICQGSLLLLNGTEREIILSTFDFSDLSEEEKETRVLQLCERIRKQTNIQTGKLLSAALLKLGHSKYALFISAHHLVIDGFSWNVLLDDLRKAIDSIKAGGTIRLSRKSASIIDWDNALLRYSSHIEGRELAFWQELEDSRPPQALRESYRLERLFDYLDAEKTQLLMRDICQAYEVNPNSVLLTALARALSDDEERYQSIVELEHHGRTIEGIDMSRTIGWFTSLYPFRLVVSPEDGIKEQVVSVNNDLAKIKDGGIGYGILKYLSKNLSNCSGGCALRFNYLGDFDSVLNTSLFSFNKWFTGAERPVDAYMATNREINAMVVNRELHMEIWYNKACYTRSEIRTLLDRYLSELDTVLTHLAHNVDQVRFQPERLDTVHLDQEDINMLFN